MNKRIHDEKWHADRMAETEAIRQEYVERRAKPQCALVDTMSLTKRHIVYEVGLRRALRGG